jgi:hypothetical protein
LLRGAQRLGQAVVGTPWFPEITAQFCEIERAKRIQARFIAKWF